MSQSSLAGISASRAQLARRTSATELSETKRVTRQRRVHHSYNQSQSFIPVEHDDAVKKPNDSHTVVKDESTFELSRLRAEIEERRRDQVYRDQELHQIMASDDSSDSVRASETIKVNLHMEPTANLVTFYGTDETSDRTESESCIRALCRSLRCQVF
mmetsp:Transcript_28080/g.50295  ORF Transcript_28080/g.50295 Transcript_28080/m.50295 type:complete len:158 (-) Transcript_28080:17-490(-)